MRIKKKDIELLIGIVLILTVLSFSVLQITGKEYFSYKEIIGKGISQMQEKGTEEKVEMQSNESFEKISTKNLIYT